MAPSTKKISLLGSTGSIGTQTLDVMRQFPDAFEVEALTAHSNVELLQRQALEFRPKYLCIGDAVTADQLKATADEIGAEIIVGDEGLEQAATIDELDLVVIATVGFAGVRPTLAAARAGLDIALANKEALVCAGELIIDVVEKTGALLLPVDSEHNAIFQCLHGNEGRPIRKLLLTASGGPFRRTPRAKLAEVTRAEVLDHPNWDMGPKITVDSATMMNKGLEVIEAMWLFGQPPKKIEVVIHPQSIVHSMVEFVDGSVIAQLGATDMRHPIQHALLHPLCLPTELPALDLTKIARLDFDAVNPERFPLLGVAYEAAQGGSRVATVLNAVNEEAVGAFLDRKLGFLEMQELIIDCFQERCNVMIAQNIRESETLSGGRRPRPTFDELFSIDQESREAVKQVCQ